MEFVWDTLNKTVKYEQGGYYQTGGEFAWFSDSKWPIENTQNTWDTIASQVALRRLLSHKQGAAETNVSTYVFVNEHRNVKTQECKAEDRNVHTRIHSQFTIRALHPFDWSVTSLSFTVNVTSTTVTLFFAIKCRTQQSGMKYKWEIKTLWILIIQLK